MNTNTDKQIASTQQAALSELTADAEKLGLYEASTQQAEPAQAAVPDAMKAVIAAMQADPDYAWSWHCNIAMAFVDEGGDHSIANYAAARFMRMLAGVEPAHELPEKVKLAAQPKEQAPALYLSHKQVQGVIDGTLEPAGTHYLPFSRGREGLFTVPVYLAAQPKEQAEESCIEDPVTVPRGLIGAACSAIDKKRDAPKVLAELRRYTVGDLSQQQPAKAGPVQPAVPDGYALVKVRDDAHRKQLIADAMGLVPVQPAEAVRFACFDAETGFEEFDTQAEALEYATETLRTYRDDAKFDGEWPGDVDCMWVGAIYITHKPVATEPDEEGGIDFKLQAAHPAQAQAPLTQAASDVLAERQRQISAEGWTHEHDDEHSVGSMAWAAAAYAAASVELGDSLMQASTLFYRTGWHKSWWKPKGKRENLIRAGALILAEIERLDRAAWGVKLEGGA